VVYARRGGFTVQKFRNNKSKIKVLSISMADAGIPTPDPEIEFPIVPIQHSPQNGTDIPPSSPSQYKLQVLNLFGICARDS
jgi:hypothetical protein